MAKVKKYTSKDIDITWDAEVCIHSAICVSNLPGVFNLEKRPWINPEGGTVDEIKNLIAQCPSGALAYAVHGETAPAEPEVMGDTDIALIKNGPLRVKGKFQVIGEDGQDLEHKQVVSLCRCGASKNKPFCDGTHKSIGFES
jgi:uncharacterized Fe-S cluster protein YjdI